MRAETEPEHVYKEALVLPRMRRGTVKVSAPSARACPPCMHAHGHPHVWHVYGTVKVSAIDAKLGTSPLHLTCISVVSRQVSAVDAKLGTGDWTTSLPLPGSIRFEIYAVAKVERRQPLPEAESLSKLQASE